jgi:uncharacterized protein YdeI (YjbR/CyaY-like superfamily)
MQITQTFTPKDAADWHAWLEQHHATEKEVWVVYFKPASGKTGLSYEASVEEALCFGWIDSIIQKIDEACYARKFNPRRAGSYWSASNKARMEKLLREKRVTAAGLAVFDPSAPESASVTGQSIRRGATPIPQEIQQKLQQNEAAWATFSQLPPSHQRQYIGWIMSAKKEETRQRRLEEALARLAQGLRLSMK